MSERETLIGFWNGCYQGLEGEEITGKQFGDGEFSSALEMYLPKNGRVLDFGCGTGWALTEIAYIRRPSYGLGIDPSENGIAFARDSARLSHFNELEFVVGDEKTLSAYREEFDFAISVNTLDVLCEEDVEPVLQKLYAALRKGGTLMLCLNPIFTEEQMTGMLKMEKRGKGYYKEGVLRSNGKAKEEWEQLLGKYFTVTEYRRFALVEREQAFPRQMFVCKK